MNLAIVAAVSTLLLAQQSASPKSPRLGPARSAADPVCFTEAISRIKVCSESDGRHVTGTDPHGKVLWRRDPFVEAKLQPYRNVFPRISWVGRPSYVCAPFVNGRPCVVITFDSSQFGVVNVSDGAFVFVGQD